MRSASEHEWFGREKSLRVLSRSSFLSPTGGRAGERQFEHNSRAYYQGGTGEVLMLGLKEDSLTITFCNESFKRQFKYHLLK